VVAEEVGGGAWMLGVAGHVVEVDASRMHSHL
jgi:hypothetical protein